MHETTVSTLFPFSFFISLSLPLEDNILCAFTFQIRERRAHALWSIEHNHELHSDMIIPRAALPFSFLCSVPLFYSSFFFWLRKLHYDGWTIFERQLYCSRINLYTWFYEVTKLFWKTFLDFYFFFILFHRNINEKKNFSFLFLSNAEL